LQIFIKNTGLQDKTLEPAEDEAILWKDKTFEQGVRDILNEQVQQHFIKAMSMELPSYTWQVEIWKNIEDIVHFKNLQEPGLFLKSNF
jgi:hypothetical protein